MDNLPQITESLTAVRTESNRRSSGSILTDDQYFLLHFILGTFFGPDLRGESPQKSVLQRLAEGLPSYTSEQLAGSHIKTVDVERVYYYILRNADQSVVVKFSWLHRFFHGNFPRPGQNLHVAYPQFPDLFPPQLHPHSRFKTRYKIIENIVFINNPEISYIKPEDIERFKRLTRIESFLLDRDAPRLHFSVNDEVMNNVALQEVEPDRELNQRNGLLNDNAPKEDNSPNVPAATPASSVPSNGTAMTYSNMAPLPVEVDTRIVGRFTPGMVFLPSPPTREEWENIVTATRSGSAITGTAAMGQVGPAIGLMDIGESQDSYLFRVSLPGVKRDPREFGCEVETDGKVIIRGVTTTGERTVNRHSQVFEMQTQNLCPSGNFTISFRLPGPVDPQQFSGNFGTDGILEGLVMKGSQRRE